MKFVEIYTDGACRGNPGPGGYGVILDYTDAKNQLHTKMLSAGYQETTNNRMEILAAVVGLESLKSPCQIDLYSDSQYLVRAINEGWLEKWKKNQWFRDKKRKEIVKNQDLWVRLDALIQKHQVTFKWVKGHAGHPKNEKCDELATTAAEGPDLLVDVNYKR